MKPEIARLPNSLGRCYNIALLAGSRLRHVLLVLLILSAASCPGVAGIKSITTSPGLGPPQRLFVLSIGINHYPPTGRFPDLLLAEADAKSVSEAFADNKQLAIPQVIVRQLLGAQRSE